MRISDWSSDVCSSDLAVVVVPGFWLRILAVVDQLAGRGIQCLSENLGLRVASLEAEIFEADREREEFAERVPAQVVFLDKLFDMLRRRYAGAGLVRAEARRVGTEWGCTLRLRGSPTLNNKHKSKDRSFSQK